MFGLLSAVQFGWCYAVAPEDEGALILVRLFDKVPLWWLQLRCRHEDVETGETEDGEPYERCKRCGRLEVNPHIKTSP
jgi:hypothetical protein